MKITIGKQLLLIMLVTGISACGNSSDPGQQPIKPAVAEAIAPPKFDYKTLQEAIASTRSDMGDIQGDGISKGAAILALWGANGMKWSELQEIPNGKYGLVMKDPDTQRGQKLCARAQIIEIAVDSTVPGKKIFNGGMYDEGGGVYRFIAVGSTGEIMANSHARFCGVITGQQHYPNSAGGMAHAVHLVGMFDLPENKSH